MDDEKRTDPIETKPKDKDIQTEPVSQEDNVPIHSGNPGEPTP